jgi:hypothetical protein
MWRVNGIYLLGAHWHPADRRLEVLRRLPRDVAALILAAKSDPDSDKAWIATRRDSDADRAFVSEFMDIVEEEIDREEGTPQRPPPLN